MFETVRGAVTTRCVFCTGMLDTLPSEASSIATRPAICCQTRGSTRQAAACTSIDAFGAVTSVTTASWLSPIMPCAITIELVAEKVGPGGGAPNVVSAHEIAPSDLLFRNSVE